MAVSEMDEYSMISTLKAYPAARKWLLFALILALAFLICTVIYITGRANMLTLEVERWLVARQESRLDCVLYEWRNLGEVSASIILISLIGIACILGGYRKRILPLLLILLLLGVGIEIVGKSFISTPLPSTLRSGMTNLTCPQLKDISRLARFEVALGMIDRVAPPSHEQISWAHDVSQMPLDLRTSEPESSFPGGHAMRWSFIWLVASWLAWRHIRPRPLRELLTVLLFVFAFLGGFIQFYIGVHFISDTISGYLLGGVLACCAIAILLLNDTRRNRASSAGQRRKNMMSPEGQGEVRNSFPFALAPIHVQLAGRSPRYRHRSWLSYHPPRWW